MVLLLEVEDYLVSCVCELLIDGMISLAEKWRVLIAKTHNCLRRKNSVTVRVSDSDVVDGSRDG